MTTVRILIFAEEDHVLEDFYVNTDDRPAFPKELEIASIDLALLVRKTISDSFTTKSI